MQLGSMALENTDGESYRSKESLFFLYPGTLAATSRSGPLRQRLLPISTMSYGTILLQSMLVLEISTSLQSISTRI